MFFLLDIEKAKYIESNWFKFHECHETQKIPFTPQVKIHRKKVDAEIYLPLCINLQVCFESI